MNIREHTASTVRSIADKIAPDLSTPEAIRKHLEVTHGDQFLDSDETYCALCGEWFTSMSLTSTCTDGSFHIFETHKSGHGEFHETILHPHRH